MKITYQSKLLETAFGYADVAVSYTEYPNKEIMGFHIFVAGVDFTDFVTESIHREAMYHIEADQRRREAF
jgi:hypothetical protein